ncbi:hypothetical protein JXQ31_00145 [candidate division KSB1 bacterium]|nr:hypothetical protein [candidate division KSB1 bacterium]
MRLHILIIALFIFFLVLLQCQGQKERSLMCGTWRMIEGTYEGPGMKVVYDKDERICYKLISEEHFAVIEMFKDNPDSLFFAAVGAYSWDDTSYTEFYEASNDPAKVGESLTFQSSVKGFIWKISLEQESLTLDETWERIVKLPEKSAQ